MAYVNVTPSTATPVFTSSDPSVATINNYGWIEPISAGTTTITASLTNGGTTVTDSYTLTVVSATTDITTYTFTGSGSDATLISSGSRNIDNTNVTVLDFTGQQYGSATFNHPSDRFGVTASITDNNKWFLRDGGLYAYFAENKDFYVLDLYNGDKVTIDYGAWDVGNSACGTSSLSSTNAELTDGAWVTKNSGNVEYTMKANGTLKLSIGRYTYIKKITIEHETTPSLSFSKTSDTYELITLNYEEPILTVIPEGAKVNFSSSNEKVAKIGNADTGDLMIINTGVTTITATIPGTTATASYSLTVSADDAIWDIRNGNECYFPDKNLNGNDNTGKLMNRLVTSVPYIKMQFGNAYNSNLTMVINENGTRSARTIDENGWQQIWCQVVDNKLKPYQGTFYVFEPTLNGTLTINGIRNHDNGNSVVLVDANLTTGPTTTYNDGNGHTYYSYPIVKELSFDGRAATNQTYDLIGGHTYYLYANTPKTNNAEGSSDNWQTFFLSSFKYETNFHFDKKNVIMDETTGIQADGYNHVSKSDSYIQNIVGDGITYSIECKGGISANVDSSTGALTNISGEGSIIVTASITENGKTSKDYYVLTVPYTVPETGTKTWTFADVYNNTLQMETVSDLKSNADEWAMTYKVREYASTKDLKYINVPVLTNALPVHGDNARYFDNTAGLLFTTAIKSFGTNTNVRTDEYKMVTEGQKVYKVVNGEETELKESGDIDEALKALLNYGVDDARDNCSFITMQNGSSLTIPNLKRGQYLRIKWNRYSANNGDWVVAKNVTDLKGVSMNEKGFYVGTCSHNGKNGYHEFIVEANGDVTFTLNQNGWVSIASIDISNSFIPTEIQLKAYDGTSYMAPTTSILRKVGKDAVTEIYAQHQGQLNHTSSVTAKYSIASRTGTLTDTNCHITGDNTLNLSTGGHGRFTLVQEGFDNGFVLDRNEYEIKVYEYDYPTRTYPVTWNLENMSTATGTALGKDAGLTNANGNYKNWKAEGTDKYQLTLEPENLIAWSTKDAIDGNATVISELNGLGIRPADITKDNNIVLGSSNTGIEISSSSTEILTVPGVASGQTAYIRVKNGASPSVTAKYADGTDATLSEVYTSDGYSSYKVEGNGKDIDFYLTDVTVMQSAVSIDTKTISAAGYATEARSYPVDYTMTKTLTGDDYIAYKITGVSDNKVIATHVEYVPAGAGVMITGNVTAQTTRPIFTTDVNRTNDLSSMEGNKLIGVIDNSSMDNVWETSVENSITYYNYMLAKSGYNVIRQNGIPTAGTQINGLGFYLAYAQGTVINGITYQGGKPKNNSAYLKLTEALAVHQGLDDGNGNSAPAPKACFFINFNDDDETTAIENIPVIRGQKDVYYTLQGVRVTTPAKGNVYILNGKKIFIK